MTETGEIVVALLAAAGAAGIIGLERQAGHAEPDRRMGLRTFALYGLAGAGSAFLATRYGAVALLAGAIPFAAILVAGYVVSARETDDWGTTTEAAALVAFLVGTLAWAELYLPALSVAVATAVLLRIKVPLYEVTGTFTDQDVRAFLQFAVITALVLPLVPDEDLGPFEAFNAREIWLMVVIISAIGLVGYAALRLFGTSGLVLTGYLGGLVSSTAVTLGYSRMSRRSAGLSAGLAAGVVGASALMYPRVALEALVVAPAMARRLALPLGVMTGIGAAGAVTIWLRTRHPPAQAPDVPIRNPLTLTTALQFGALYAAIVFAAKALLDRAPEASLQIVGALSGLNDVDAITLASANLVQEGLDPAVGARAALLAVVVNTVAKAALAASLGSARLRRLVAGSLLPAAAAGFGFWLAG